MDYWTNKFQLQKAAIDYTAEMEQRFSEYIQDCADNSVIYDFKHKEIPNISESERKEPLVSLIKSDSVHGAFDNRVGKTAILNFASYKYAGGRFLDGSHAQEESLCHASWLYNVLQRFDASYYAWNRGHLNHALYTHRALYTPYVGFLDDRRFAWERFDVITCAAPNFGVAHRYQGISKWTNDIVLEERMCFIRDIAEANQVQVLILGAWGCGVFQQDAETVARLFCKTFHKTTISHLVFPIPDDKNYQVFHDEFSAKCLI